MNGVNYLYIKYNELDEIPVSEKVWSKFMSSKIKSFPPLNIDGRFYRMQEICYPVDNDEGGVTCHGVALEVDE